MAEDLIQLPTEHGARFYKTHTGLKLPSVTTILSVLAKPALIPWAAKKEREEVLLAIDRAYVEMSQVMAETPPLDIFREMINNELSKEKAYQKELRKAGTIGTQVHKRIEWEFLGEVNKARSEDPPPLDSPEAQQSFLRATEWRKATNLKVLDTERQVASLQGAYAGTLDALVEIDKRVGVIDFKTSNKGQVYPEHFLQNCAYRLALAESGVKTQAGWIILLPKSMDGEAFSVVEVPPLETLVAPWMAAVSLYRWTQAQRRKKKEDDNGKA